LRKKGTKAVTREIKNERPKPTIYLAQRTHVKKKKCEWKNSVKRGTEAERVLKNAPIHCEKGAVKFIERVSHRSDLKVPNGD